MKTQFQTFLLYTYCRNTYPKGRALMKMYRVVLQTKKRELITGESLDIHLNEFLIGHYITYASLQYI